MSTSDQWTLSIGRDYPKHSYIYFSLFFYVATHAIWYAIYIYAIHMENWTIGPRDPTQLALAKKSAAAARCHMAHVLQDGPGSQFQLLPGCAIFPWRWSQPELQNAVPFVGMDNSMENHPPE